MSATEILATIRRNVDAGDSGDDARTSWSSNPGGEAITIEMEIPAWSHPDSAKGSVTAPSHVVVDIDKVESMTKSTGACTLDVSRTSQHDQLGNAVAFMDFVEGEGLDHVCAATWMNDRMSCGIPYVLGASRCISTQSIASALAACWNRKAASCNSTRVNSCVATGMRPSVSLLYASADADTSFMRLTGLRPAGETGGNGASAFTRPMAETISMDS